MMNQVRYNSRSRVATTLNHKEPDRVPADLSITLDAYKNVRDFLGLEPEESIDADRFFEVRPSFDVLKALGVDLTFVRLRNPKKTTEVPLLTDGTRLDEWGIGLKRVELANGSFLNELSYSPLKNLHPAEINLNAYSWPDPYDPGRSEGLEEEARWIYENTELAIMGRFGGPILELGFYMRGYEQWLMDLVLHPEFVKDFLDRVVNIQIALDEIGIRAAGKYLSILKVSGEDLGMQDRPLFSMKVWRNLLLPPLQKRWLAARRALDEYAPQVKIMLHSDGAIRSFLPDIIGSAVDIIDPVQPVCEGMDLAGLKQDFGDKLSFHGAVDTQYLLPFCNPGEVEAETIRCMQSLGASGGYIAASSHFIQSDVPPENIVAMYKAIHKYGHYPISKVYHLPNA